MQESFSCDNFNIYIEIILDYYLKKQQQIIRYKISFLSIISVGFLCLVEYSRPELITRKEFNQYLQTQFI